MGGEDCDALPTAKWNQILTAALGLFLAIMAVTANALIIIVVYRTASLHSVTHYFIACLAAGDLFVGAVSLPLWIARSLLKVAEEDHPLSIGVDCVYTLSVAISTYNLCAISLERYVGVVFPLRYSNLVTVRRFVYVAVSVWIMSLCIACMRLFINEDQFWIASISLAFLLPGLVISFCYIRIFCEASRQVRSIADRMASTSVSQINNKKASITVAIIIGVFYISSLPALVFSITEVVTNEETTCQEIKTHESWGIWALFLAFSNAALNPWIYAARKREFRTALKLVLCGFPAPVE